MQANFSFLPRDPRIPPSQSDNRNNGYQTSYQSTNSNTSYQASYQDTSSTTNYQSNSSHGQRSYSAGPSFSSPHTPGRQTHSHARSIQEAATGRFSPIREDAQTSSRTDSNGTPSKRRFIIYNKLEMGGIAARIRLLESEIKVHPTDSLRLELESLRRQELGSCYQTTKDSLAETREELASAQTAQTTLRESLEQSQAVQESLREEIRIRDTRLAESNTSRESALSRAWNAETEKETLKRNFESKKRRFDERTTELTDEQQGISRQLEQVQRESGERITALEAQIQSEREKSARLTQTLTKLNQKFEETQNKYALAKIQANDSQVAFEKSSASQALLEEQLAAEKRQNEILEESVAALTKALDNSNQQTSALLEEKTELLSTVDGQQKCILGINQLIHNLQPHLSGQQKKE